MLKRCHETRRETTNAAVSGLNDRRLQIRRRHRWLQGCKQRTTKMPVGRRQQAAATDYNELLILLWMLQHKDLATMDRYDRTTARPIRQQ